MAAAAVREMREIDASVGSLLADDDRAMLREMLAEDRRLQSPDIVVE